MRTLVALRVKGGEANVSQDVSAMRERMAVIRKEVADEVEARWTSPYRTPEVFDLKVNARLTSHAEYRALRERVRDAEAAQAAQSEETSTD